jgi:hypothetical protein
VRRGRARPPSNALADLSHYLSLPFGCADLFIAAVNHPRPSPTLLGPIHTYMHPSSVAPPPWGPSLHTTGAATASAAAQRAGGASSPLVGITTRSGLVLGAPREPAPAPTFDRPQVSMMTVGLNAADIRRIYIYHGLEESEKRRVSCGFITRSTLAALRRLSLSLSLSLPLSLLPPSLHLPPSLSIYLSIYKSIQHIHRSIHPSPPFCLLHLSLLPLSSKKSDSVTGARAETGRVGVRDRGTDTDTDRVSQGQWPSLDCARNCRAVACRSWAPT